MNYEVSCPHCAQNVSVAESALYTCPHCAQDFDFVIPNSNVATVPQSPPAPRPEDPLFAESGVYINRSQVMANGCVFAVPQIAGVIRREIPAKRQWLFFWILIGILLIGGHSYIVGVPLTLLCLLECFRRRAKYDIALQTNGTEYSMHFKKADQADRCAFALSQALSLR